MYVDEIGANEHTVHRYYGWSPKGKPATLVTPLKRSSKWSILPLYTYEGFTDWMIVQSSFNGELFAQFLEEHVILYTNPYPGPRSVLIMDNCRIHEDEVVDIRSLSSLSFNEIAENSVF